MLLLSIVPDCSCYNVLHDRGFLWSDYLNTVKISKNPHRSWILCRMLDISLKIFVLVRQNWIRHERGDLNIISYSRNKLINSCNVSKSSLFWSGSGIKEKGGWVLAHVWSELWVSPSWFRLAWRHLSLGCVGPKTLTSIGQCAHTLSEIESYETIILCLLTKPS